MALELRFGFATQKGPRERNEDYGGFVTPDVATTSHKGYLAALADGVSGCSNGREAAEAAVRGLLNDYYATPETWEVPHALGVVLTTINRWMAGRCTHREQVMATTLTALVLRGRQYYYAHVGDSRLYQLRDGCLQQISTDHVWEQAGLSHVLKRAVGLDTHLVVDFGSDDVTANDLYLLVSDGVWEPLGHARMLRQLQRYENPQTTAEALVQEALEQGGQDNASALLVQVMAVADEDDPLSIASDLPLPGKLKPNALLDEFIIEAELCSSRKSLLYRAKHRHSGQPWVIKTLPPILRGDLLAARHLLTEEWLYKRVCSAYLPQVLPLPNRCFLYFAVSYHGGQTLQAMMDAGHHFPAAAVAILGIRALRGLAALHRLDIVHRDIKPDNLHLDYEHKLRILDLGVATCPALREQPAWQNRPGTPSYMAPELFAGQPASWQSDLYALGVTLYHLLTRHYPHGEIEPFQTPKFGIAIPPARYRPDIPLWLENIILKAVERDPKKRFETAEEMLLALEKGEASPLVRTRTPLVERSAAGAWPLVAIISVVMNILLLLLLLAS